ncbi:MAG: hypothetical protein HY280_00020 [Nitrospinae bacterium]|nr:hypothetical protein [Nitrospinota bacterium]
MFKLANMKGRIGTALAVFLLFIITDTVATYMVVSSQKNEAVLAGGATKIKTLVQRAGRESADVAGGQTDSRAFEETLKSVSASFAEFTALSAQASPESKGLVDEISSAWAKYKDESRKIIESAPAVRDATLFVKQAGPILQDELDRMGRTTVAVQKQVEYQDLRGLAPKISKEILAVGGDPEAGFQLRNDVEDFEKNLTSLRTSAKDAPSVSACAAVGRIWGTLHRHADNASAQGLVLSKAEAARQKLEPALLDGMEKLSVKIADSGLRWASSLEYLQIILFFSSILMFIWALFAVAKNISSPLVESTLFAGRLSEGNFSGGVAVSSSVEEVRQLGATLNSMTSNLRGLLRQIREAASTVQDSSQKLSDGGGHLRNNTDAVNNSITSTAEAVVTIGKSAVKIQGRTSELAVSTESVSSSIEEMGVSIRDTEKVAERITGAVNDASSSTEQTAISIQVVAQNAANIAKLADEEFNKISDLYKGVTSFSERADLIGGTAHDVSSSLEQLAANIRDVASNSEHAGKLSKQTADDAQKGREALGDAISAMESIRTLVDDAAKVIESLGDRASSIGNIITVIDDIAEQTNLLALNAAIEAARAGEHGKGFAVVAEEVRKLAERSSVATKEIAQLIKGVQEESLVAVNSMKRGTIEVEKGAKLAQNSGNALNTIVKGVETTVNLVATIAATTKEQQAASSQVTNAMVEMVEQASEIKSETARLEKSTAEIMDHVKTMKANSSEIARSTMEQSSGMNLIAQSILGLGDVSQQMLVGTKEQTGAANQIIQEVSNISNQLFEIKNETAAQAETTKNIGESMGKVSALSLENKNMILNSIEEIKNIAEQAHNLVRILNGVRLDEETTRSISPSPQGVSPAKLPS